MTMITPSYLGETIEYSSLHACRSTLEDPTRHKVSTPVNWKNGEDVLLQASVTEEEAQKFAGGVRSPKPYIRIVAQPK